MNFKTKDGEKEIAWKQDLPEQNDSVFAVALAHELVPHLAKDPTTPLPLAEWIQVIDQSLRAKDTDDSTDHWKMTGIAIQRFTSEELLPIFNDSYPPTQSPLGHQTHVFRETLDPAEIPGTDLDPGELKLLKDANAYVLVDTTHSNEDDASEPE